MMNTPAKGIGVGKSLMLILILVVLIFTTVVIGDIFTSVLGMGIGDEFHLTMGELSVSYTTSSSFQEKTEIEENLPMACERVVFRNNTLKAYLEHDEFYFVSYTTQEMDEDFEVECDSFGGVKFIDGRIEASSPVDGTL